MKIGLVLSGGGGKGAYELGVWKALRELKIDKHIDVFSGTSIGAFNAVLFAQNDLEVAEALWDEVTIDKIVPISKLNLLKKGIGLFIGRKNINFAKKYINQKSKDIAVSKDGAREIINKYLNIEEVKRNNKICYAACTELPDFNAKYFKLNNYDDDMAKEIIIASASLPLIYEATDIMGGKYIDGGISDNTPIEPVYEEGCDIIIVVLLSKEARVNRDLYPNTHIIELYPRNLKENIINGTLNLDDRAKKQRIKEGYYDTKTSIEPIMKLVERKLILEQEESFPKLFKIYSYLKKILSKDKENDIRND